MRRQLACALAALILGWFSGQGQAQTPPPPEPMQSTCTAPATACGVLGPGCCDDHGGGCHYHWELGAGVLYMQPAFKTNPAFKTTTTNAAGTLTTTTQTDFSYNMQAAPTAWLAWVNDCGFGLRGRWFQYDQGSSVNVTNPGPTGLTTITSVNPNFGTTPLASVTAGDTLSFTSRLRLDVWDFEGTYTFCCGNWSMLVGAGVRYANMQQSYSATNTLAPVVAPPVVPPVVGNVIGAAAAVPAVAGTLNSSHTFNGAGPSLALEAKRGFGATGFALYGNARAAILFGTGNENVSQINAAGVTTVLGSASQFDVLPVGEIEVGLEWGREFGRARVYVQTGFIGQAWFSGGNAANTNLGATTSSNDTNFGFVGVAFRAGVNF